MDRDTCLEPQSDELVVFIANGEGGGRYDTVTALEPQSDDGLVVFVANDGGGYDTVTAVIDPITIARHNPCPKDDSLIMPHDLVFGWPSDDQKRARPHEIGISVLNWPH
jgi:hypothetical protein